VSGRDREGLIEVIHGKCDPVHPDVVGPRRVRLDRIGMDVLEKLEAVLCVWRLEDGDFGVVAVEVDRGVGPFSTDSRRSTGQRLSPGGKAGTVTLEDRDSPGPRAPVGSPAQ
jgi:hypothetical protein